jgi:di/tricarboxylate transporter
MAILDYVLDRPLASHDSELHMATRQIAREAHADPKAFMVGLAVCISTSFCTPIAHETTMLVMGPGRYRFKDYIAIGSGMAIIAWLLATVVTPIIWKF